MNTIILEDLLKKNSIIAKLKDGGSYITIYSGLIKCTRLWFDLLVEIESYTTRDPALYENVKQEEAVPKKTFKKLMYIKNMYNFENFEKLERLEKIEKLENIETKKKKGRPRKD